MRKQNKSKTNGKSNVKGVGKTKTHNSKRPRQAREFDEDDRSQGRVGNNDPSWYSADAALLRDSASIPFSWATGTRTDIFDQALSDPFPTSGGEFIVPGICSIKLMPTFGTSQYQTDPLNIAATSVYSFVRHANSGSSNYDAPDLMLYIMSMSQIYSYINFLQRVYGCSQLYVQRNRYLPMTLLKTMGVDYDSIMNHLSDFRYGINVLINKVSSLAVPAEFTLFNRLAFLYQNVYTEGSSIKDQIYLYNPDGFWKFQFGTPGQLVYVPFTPAVTSSFTHSTSAIDVTPLFSYQQLLEYGNILLDAIMLDEDMNIMSGDILKAYGDRIMKVASLEPNYVIAPVFDIGVLEQMHNAIPFVNIWSSNTTSLKLGKFTFDVPVIKQDANTNAIISTPCERSCMQQYVSGSGNERVQFRSYAPYFGAFGSMSSFPDSIRSLIRRSILTTTTADATPELIMESTRLMVAAAPGTVPPKSTDNYGPLLSCGTEVAQSVEIWDAYVADGTWNSRKATFSSVALVTGSNKYASGYVPFNEILASKDFINTSDCIFWLNVYQYFRRSPFKFIPGMEVVRWGVENSEGVISTVTNEGVALDYAFDNYAILDRVTLAKLHETALLNQLHVPSIAKLG